MSGPECWLAHGILDTVLYRLLDSVVGRVVDRVLNRVLDHVLDRLLNPHSLIITKDCGQKVSE